jgi:hypothetical protein
MFEVKFKMLCSDIFYFHKVWMKNKKVWTPYYAFCIHIMYLYNAHYLLTIICYTLFIMNYAISIREYEHPQMDVHIL